MPRAVIMSFCAVLIAAGLGVADASAASGSDRALMRSGCIPKKGKTTILARNGHAVVFQRTKHDSEGPIVIDYGCLLRRGKRVRLGVDDTNLNQLISEIQLAGRYAAYRIFEYEDLGSGADSVRVVNLRTGRIAGVAGVEASLKTLVLARSGAVAWSSELREDQDREPAANPQLNKITKLDALGKLVVDCGAGVSVASLRLSGRRMSWKSSGQARAWNLDRPVAEQTITPPSTESC
jgi:hypothetical protein